MCIRIMSVVYHTCNIDVCQQHYNVIKILLTIQHLTFNSTLEFVWGKIGANCKSTKDLTKDIFNAIHYYMAIKLEFINQMINSLFVIAIVIQYKYINQDTTSVLKSISISISIVNSFQFTWYSSHNNPVKMLYLFDN